MVLSLNVGPSAAMAGNAFSATNMAPVNPKFRNIPAPAFPFAGSLID
jgi:hypothetical protein